MMVIELALKASLLMLVAAGVTRAMRQRASAASRHLVWTLAIVGVLALPAISAVIPAWRITVSEPVGVVVAPAVDLTEPRLPAVANTVVAAPTPRAVAFVRWLPWLPALYGAGVIILLGRLGLEQFRMRRVLSRTRAVTEPGWTDLLHDCARRAGVMRAVELVRSSEEAMPMVCGIRRPRIVLPAVAELWEEGRRRAVLLHELAHVARYDCLTQLLAEAAVALYWPHPGAWWMARRLRVERELACDDCVLISGTEPREYAGHLLEIAHSLGGYQAPALALRMARPRQLEGRMLAMLDATRRRAAPGKSGWIALAAAALIVAPLSAATLMKAAAPAERIRGAAAVAQASANDAAPPPGTWQVHLLPGGRTAALTVSPSEHSSHGTTVSLDRIEGLAAVLTGPGGPVRYTVKRDAGMFAFEGVVRNGAGGGVFSFAPSATFPLELIKRGFARPTPVELQALAWMDIGFPFIDELTAQQYTRPTLTQLVNSAQHGVSLAYVRELAGLGYRLGTVDALARLRDHGVSGEYIRSLQAFGLHLTSDELVRARDHGVSPEYVREMRTLGYESMTLDELVNSRDHGVGPDYVNQIAAVGYQHPSLAELIQMRDHGITPQYVREVEKHGDRPPINKLISLHDRGLTSEDSEQHDYRVERMRQSHSMLAHVHAMVLNAWLRWTGEGNQK